MTVKYLCSVCYRCYFDVLYLIFELFVAGCCNIEIHTCLCAIMRRVIIKVTLLNHCNEDEKESVLFFFLKKATNKPAVYLSGYQTFWKLQGFRRLRSDLSGFLNRKDTNEHATNQSRVHDNSFTSTTMTNCSDLPGENKRLLYFLIELLTHIRVEVLALSKLNKENKELRQRISTQ